MDGRTIILVPESTRKERDGDPNLRPADDVVDSLPPTERTKLRLLRERIAKETNAKLDKGLLPAYLRFQGNMYRAIPRDAWEHRAPGVEVLIASALYGLVASRDTVRAYPHSMAEPMPPLGKLNRWWHEGGLPAILAAYLRAVRPRIVVDLLSLEYREAVEGFHLDAAGIEVRRIDFPGMGRASQPRRGEKVSEILREGKV